MRTLLIISGTIKKDTETGVWRTCQEGEGDDFGITCDHRRMKAAKILFNEALYDLFVTTGGLGQLKKLQDPTIPTIGSVMAEELVGLGIPRSQIIIEEDSDNTWQQLENVQKMIVRGIIPKDNLALLGQEYQNFRIVAMIYQNRDTLPDLFGIPIIAAERVLINDDPKVWSPCIEATRNSPEMQERMEKESRGAHQILEGTYRYA